MAPHKLNPEDWACIEDVNVLSGRSWSTSLDKDPEIMMLKENKK